MICCCKRWVVMVVSRETRTSGNRSRIYVRRAYLGADERGFPEFKHGEDAADKFKNDEAAEEFAVRIVDFLRDLYPSRKWEYAVHEYKGGES